MHKKLLILGFGYTAQQFSKILAQTDYSIIATTRQSTQKESALTSNIKFIPFSQDSICCELKNTSHILISTPPNSNGLDPSFDLIKNQLIKHRTNVEWVGYLSSTNVYGDHDGQWVTETADLNTALEAGLNRIKAENNWLSLFHEYDIPIHIFRLAAIYGPKRNNVFKILNNTKHESIVKKDHVFSRIHVEDISRALYESISVPTPGEVYNLADDRPCASELVDAFATELLGMPNLSSISLAQATLSKRLKNFYLDNKRVSNKKFKNHFKFKFRFPSYKEGLTFLHRKLGSPYKRVPLKKKKPHDLVD